MADLSERIVQTSNEVSDLLRQLVQDMQEIGAWIQEADTCRDRLLGEIATASGSVQQLSQSFQNQIVRINDYASQINEQAEGWLTEVTTINKSFEETIDATEAAFAEYQESIEHCGKTAVDLLENEFTQDLQSGHAVLEQTQENLKTWFGDFDSALQEFAEKTEELQTDWKGFIDQNLQALNSTAEDAVQAVQNDLVEFLDRQAQEFARAIEQTVTGPLTDGAQNVMDTARNALEDQIKSLISAISQHFNAILRQISDDMTQSTSSSSKNQELLKPIFDELQEVTEILKVVMEAVKQIAEMVGIHV